MSISIPISASPWPLLEFDGEPKAELKDTWTNMVADHDFVDLTLEPIKGIEFIFHILRVLHLATQLRFSPHYFALLDEGQIAEEIQKVIVKTRQGLILKAPGTALPHPEARRISRIFRTCIQN